MKAVVGNRNLSKAIHKQKFSNLSLKVKYKCGEYSIEFIEVDRFSSTTKKCPSCDEIEKDLQQKDYMYTWGLRIDWDLNVVLNLRKVEKLAA